jgi:hypothetical protein
MSDPPSLPLTPRFWEEELLAARKNQNRIPMASSKKPAKKKTHVSLKDLKPSKNPKGGVTIDRQHKPI